MFFVNAEIERQSARLSRCITSNFLNLASSQWGFELSIYKASITHVDRTYDKNAAVQLIPFMPYWSSRVNRCHGESHATRLKILLHIVRSIPKHISIVMTCTCVMQSAIFGQNVLSELHSLKIIQLTHSTRPYPLSISSNAIVVPYYSEIQERASCPKNKLVFWRGSRNVANRQASSVRNHILEFASHPAYNVAATNRVCAKGSAPCISGSGEGRDSKLKHAMRQNMSRYDYCLIPEGDSPDSSRIWDAINALCVPVVISSRLAVPRSDIWKDHVVVVPPEQFFRMNASAMLRRLRATNVTCTMRLQLRHDNSATLILHKLSEFVHESRSGHVHSTIGR